MSKNTKNQKPTLIKSTVFSFVVAVAIFAIAVNILLLIGLVYVIVSPRYEPLSTSTFVMMGAVSALNVIVVILLLVLRRWFEHRVDVTIVSPLREIERQIENFARGDYQETVSYAADNEIGDLFKAVERVRVQLSDYREHERNANVAKQVYFSGLMHDIATPVTRINGCASMIADGMVKDADSIKRLSSVILNNTEDINIMLKSLAAVEKYNEPDFQMDLQPVDISKVLGIYVSDLNLSTNAENITVTFENKCKMSSVSMIDLKSCKRALVNLINNSIKYRKRDCDCKIKITIEDYDNDTILFSIADNGVGVEPGSENMIFEMFYRGDTARRNVNEGSGLGLFIAKQILILNNIRIWAKNNGNGLTIFALLHRSEDKPASWFELEN